MNANKKFLHKERRKEGICLVIFFVLLLAFLYTDLIAIITIYHIHQAHSTMALINTTESSYNMMDILPIVTPPATVMVALLTVVFIFWRREA